MTAAIPVVVFSFHNIPGIVFPFELSFAVTEWENILFYINFVELYWELVEPQIFISPMSPKFVSRFSFITGLVPRAAVCFPDGCGAENNAA